MQIYDYLEMFSRGSSIGCGSHFIKQKSLVRIFLPLVMSSRGSSIGCGSHFIT
jgi:hypothetical protein